MAPRPTAPLSLAEATCLTLVVQGIEHGWAVGTALAADGELGVIWSLSRPLTYRALEGLVERGLIRRTNPSQGTGRDRSILRPTASGRRASQSWLDTPAAHLRDLRTELLLKLALRQRAGMPIEPLLDAQELALEPALDALTHQSDHNDLVALWRQEGARAARRFLRQARTVARGVTPAGERPRTEVRLSARNQLHASIDSLARGDVMTSVRAVLPDGQRLTAAITSDAVDELDLAVGDQVVMIVKSTEIMVAKPD